MFVRGRRRASALAAVLLAIAMTACVPEPTPTPTPTGFATEEEAFRAAEETYRAYVDALNEVDLADPATFEPVFAWLTGDALDASKRSLSQMHADKWVVDGDTSFDSEEPVSFAGLEQTAVIDVCLDVTSVSVINAAGESVVPDDRPSRQRVRLEFQPSDESPTGLLIASSEALGVSQCG